MKPEKQIIGKRIKTLIEISNIPLKQIASEMGMTYQNLFKIFRKDSVDSRFLFQLASFLNIPIEDFFNTLQTEFHEDFVGEAVFLRDVMKAQKDRIEELESIIGDKQEIISFLRELNNMQELLFNEFKKDKSSLILSLKNDALTRNEHLSEEDYDSTFEEILQDQMQKNMSMLIHRYFTSE